MNLIVKSVFVSLILLICSSTYGQTYTTLSKKCGSCGKAVSNNSTIGMRCPHCGVRWGYENQSTRTSTRTRYYDYDDSYNKTSGLTSSKANLRSAPSTKSSIVAVVPAYTFVTILSSKGDWYYVKYSSYNGYHSDDLKGYIHETIIN